jgi:hypothetical protein
MGGTAVLDMHSFSFMTSLLDGAYTVVFVLSLVAFARLTKKWAAQQDFENCTIQVREEERKKTRSVRIVGRRPMLTFSTLLFWGV